MKLVSGVMPTRSRPSLAAKALDCFLSQRYPEKEIVILDDVDDPSFPVGVNHELVRYHRVSERLNIPAKRNRVNALAAGSVIAHWDSDDYYEPDRISTQVQLLEHSGLNVCGFHSLLFHAENGECRRYVGGTSYALGTSLCYTKSWWESHRFREDKTVGEDNDFVKTASQSKQLVTCDGGQWIVARIHSGNTSPKNGGIGYVKVDASALPQGFFA